VLLSVAADNRDGLPAPETIETLDSCNLVCTDQHGRIELTPNGEQMWVEVGRK